ncbi:aldolase catalytic domain-containing protein [uncultured Subdoligranulum sp.]|uniref:aldolase catalytic domain-containing protein n=1 Tax=uncultured Subdoligranulum sp. TaxID=512298 RepID=UPI0025E07480|nr:aldolase catalytic domain-containing protein [uncultured Subdoligranulum sp.]
MPDIKLLDCTLRDGGYINDWNWGFGSARRIIQSLTRAGTDLVEVGFLRNVEGYNPDVTVCNTIEELNRLLPPEGQRGHTMYSGMAMRSNYDIAKLSPYDGHGIEVIRITAHDYDIRDGMDFAREVKARGYKLSINPINIMGYADKDLLWIFDQVNAIHPWQFSIVDTFGSMRRRDLERIVSLADHNLAPDIRLGLHLHENMALSFCLAQEFMDRPMLRDKTVDASLMGMGRAPGNLPIELVADYRNETGNCHYDLDEIMDAIQDHIAPIKGESQWGYTPAYFLSARFNLHRNYAEHLLNKGDLTNRDINHILAAIDDSKKTVFDAAYADKLYTEYRNRRTDDAAALAALQTAFGGKRVLVLAPGASLATAEGRAAVQAAGADVTVSANFVPDFVQPDYAFFTNAKRFDEEAVYPCPVILTSNLRADTAATVVNYDRLAGTDAQGGNSVLMLLRLLRLCGASEVLLAGADGYRAGTPAYADAGLHTHTGRGDAYNAQVAGAIRAAGLPVQFVTPSEYERV